MLTMGKHYKQALPRSSLIQLQLRWQMRLNTKLMDMCVISLSSTGQVEGMLTCRTPSPIGGQFQFQERHCGFGASTLPCPSKLRSFICKMGINNDGLYYPTPTEKLFSCDTVNVKFTLKIVKHFPNEVGFFFFFPPPLMLNVRFWSLSKKEEASDDLIA